MLSREVLTVNVGQAGIQVGSSIWKQYCSEHGVKPDGTLEDGPAVNRRFSTFFNETDAGQYVPRNLSVDLEPTVLDGIRNGEYAQIFSPEFLINTNEDAANNFARGHYTVGLNIMHLVDDRLRKLVENSRNVQGFILNHSIGGGTGSGLTPNILSNMCRDYGKKTRIGFEIFPSPNISTCIVEPYNAMFCVHWLLDHTDVSIVLDNEAIYEICQKQLDVESPNYADLNLLISKVVSSMTASLRFDGELNVNLEDFQTNLVPFPRLHFMTSSLAPFHSNIRASYEPQTVQEITDQSLQPQNMLVKYGTFDPAEDKYMAITLHYRGDISPGEANTSIQWVKKNNKISFIEWCPTGFKVGVNAVPAAIVQGDITAPTKKSVSMIGNNVAVTRVFTERINRKCDLMYAQRAFIHWYCGEGMEHSAFRNAREDLAYLERDYRDVLRKPTLDDLKVEEKEY